MIYDGQPNGLHTLCGTQPGLLDPSQPSRLLRFPDSQLSFASFDPKTAFVDNPGTQKLSNTTSPTPPKRIVIETTPKGTNSWRFVPRARLGHGAQDEGVWPRIIDICGEKVNCYQEQWEIYKLDPKYHCVVHAWPKCSSITWAELQDRDSESVDPDSGKRSRFSSPETGKTTAQKKARPRPLIETDVSDLETDEDQVEKMIIDESFSQKPKIKRRPNPTSREKINRARRNRWARNRSACDKQDLSAPAEGSFSMRVDSDNTQPSQSTTWLSEESSKRKDVLQESDNDIDRMPSDRGVKRVRTTSPKPRKGVNRNRYGKKHLDRLRQYTNLDQTQRVFTEHLRSAFIPPEPTQGIDENEVEPDSTEAQSQENDGSGETSSEDDHSHEAQIAKSIRKLRELEKDRPLWEAHRQEREARERAEEQEQLARAERRRREEEERLQQEREAAEREKRRIQQEAERRMREEEARQREIRQRRQRQRWEVGPWTTHRALERYRMLSEEFDAAKFSTGESITFFDVPWPVLHPPSRLTVEDIDWSAVETFFASVKAHMRLQDYKEFVEKSHRRFHPDRWRARKIWAAVTDDVERSYLEVAANTVAQALTPIWRTVKEE